MVNMKTIILNGSPRKNWNTAMMLKEAQKGAESVGAETEYIFPLIPPGMAGRKTTAGGYSPAAVSNRDHESSRNVLSRKKNKSELLLPDQ